MDHIGGLLLDRLRLAPASCGRHFRRQDGRRANYSLVVCRQVLFLFRRGVQPGEDAPSGCLAFSELGVVDELLVDMSGERVVVRPVLRVSSDDRGLELELLDKVDHLDAGFTQMFLFQRRQV